MKNNKLVKIIFIFVIAFYITLLLANTSFAGTLTSDINGINDNQYPGIKSMIQDLQRKHKNYQFQVYYTGIDWTEAITMEYQGHGSSPKNLFSQSSKYQGKWFCPICGSKSYDTGWYCASIDAIKYMMDPRNSLDETSVFQFKNLETADVSANNISTVINSQYASYGYINNPTAINAIVNASSSLNLNGYSILAKIINEQGKGTSPLATGSGYNGFGIGYYNFFNVGAYGNGISNVMTNGLKYAQNKGWDSVEKSIFGGSEYYKSQYIGKGQNTLHYQRFNVVYTPSLFSHQYQQDIMGAQTSSTLLKNYYTTSSTINSVNHTFIIPLYENMPRTACARPSTSENSTLNAKEVTVTTDRLAVRATPNGNRIISYLNRNEKVQVIERATSQASDGNYWDIIVSNIDGTYGYVLRSGLFTQNPYPSYIFDYKYYADNNKDLKAAFGYDENQLYDHFVKNGASEGRSSSPVFNARYYLENNGDLQRAFGNNYLLACNHFLNYGCNEGRRSSAEYDGTFYKYYYPDLTNMSAVQLVEHYINYGKKERRLATIDPKIEEVVFDETIYSEYNDDLKKAFGKDRTLLRRHWIECGIKEGRIASALYIPDMYIELNMPLKDVFGNNRKLLFEHFINCGINEGRSASVFFDPKLYLEINTDIKSIFKTNYKEAYSHFRNCGIKEGRQASSVFNIKYYLQYNADLKAAYGNNEKSAFVHFLRYGMHEGRIASATFNPIFYSNYNTDLKKAYGNNKREYYMHYIRYGRDEGRKAI